MEKIDIEFVQEAKANQLIIEEVIPVLIYCDPGIDDAIMLAHVLTSSRFEVLGIICSAGNTAVENTVANALRICEISGRPDLKVFAGAKGPLISSQGADAAPLSGVHVYGVKGLGKTQLPEPVMKAQSGDAITFAVETIMQSPFPVTIVSTAGLTDVYLTLDALERKSKAHIANIRAISMMGGALNTQVYANAPLSASTPWAEFNIIYDALASNKFFKFCAANNVKIFMAPLDLTYNVLFSTQQLRDLRGIPQNQLIALVAELLADVPGYYLEKFGSANPSQPMHDLMATMCLIHPELFVGEWVSVKCSSNDDNRPGLLTKKAGRDINNVFVLDIHRQRIPKFFKCFFDDLGDGLKSKKNVMPSDISVNVRPDWLINNLREIHDKAVEARQYIRVVLSEEKQNLVADVDKSIASIMGSLSGIIKKSQQLITEKFNPVDYCLTSLPVITSGIQSIMATNVKGVNDPTCKAFTLEILEALFHEADNLLRTITPKTKATPSYNDSEDQELQLQQAKLIPLPNCVPSEMQNIFFSALTKIRECSIGKYRAPNVFISWARPKDANQHEHWIGRFLEVLHLHLRSTGIIPNLDLIDSAMGFAPTDFMKRIDERCTHVIVIGTLSLAEKDLGKGHMVQTELNLVRRAGSGGPVILPILLSGVFEKAFPVDFPRYTGIDSFPEHGYLVQLQRLISFLITGDVKNDLFEEIWRPFMEKYSKEFPAPKQLSLQAKFNKLSAGTSPATQPSLVGDPWNGRFRPIQEIWRPLMESLNIEFPATEQVNVQAKSTQAPDSTVPAAQPSSVGDPWNGRFRPIEEIWGPLMERLNKEFPETKQVNSPAKPSQPSSSTIPAAQPSLVRASGQSFFQPANANDNRGSSVSQSPQTGPSIINHETVVAEVIMGADTPTDLASIVMQAAAGRQPPRLQSRDLPRQQGGVFNSKQSAAVVVIRENDRSKDSAHKAQSDDVNLGGYTK